MLSNNTEPGTAPSKPAESPGRLLAAARETHSLSPADLAVRLRLDTKIVMALERDDFENLPEPTFIKGYIRSIAKELNIDARAVLESYEAHALNEPPALADFSSRAPDQIGINSTIIKAITYGLTAVLIVLIVLWWRTNYRNDASDGGATLEEETTASGAIPLSYTYPIVEHEQSTWRVTSPATPEPGDEAAPEEIPAEENDVAVASTDSHRLFIATTNEAWVEVYDANGAKLHFGLTETGSPIELDGQTYYRLILGNSASITLRYNDEEIDLGPHSKDGVAQLELGTAPDNND